MIYGTQVHNHFCQLQNYLFSIKGKINNSPISNKKLKFGIVRERTTAIHLFSFVNVIPRYRTYTFSVFVILTTDL